MSEAIGQAESRYHFILNPYVDVRFNSCPKCHARTLLRKLALVVHVDGPALLTLNKSCRYCPRCDILIAHRDELESLLTFALEKRKPELIGNEYLVLGTIDRKTWKRADRGEMRSNETIREMHHFKEVLDILWAPAGWQSP